MAATIPVRVAVRVRPLLPLETDNGCAETLTCSIEDACVYLGHGSSSDATRTKQFTFDYVYPGSESFACNRLYDECVLPLLDGCFKGLNATVLAYGQTGSGKTYTMGTDGSNMDGVIPRVAKDIFSKMKQDKSASFEYSVKISFLEIYCEEIRDLLNGSSGLSVREDSAGNTFIHGLSEEVVKNEADIRAMIAKGSRVRATASTNMNSTSSRSHAIITLTIRAENVDTKEARVSKLHLVDLAGSERAKRTKAQGQRLQEGIDINKGLLSLGNVISALGDENKGPQFHIPYRDSKLTRLLQDSLGGNSRTVMIACASPADVNFDETTNTLKYANRARNIKNKPKANKEDTSDLQNKLILQLREEISRLEAELDEAKNQINPSKTRETCNVVLRLSERNAYLEGLFMELKNAKENTVSQNVALPNEITSVIEELDSSNNQSSVSSFDDEESEGGSSEDQEHVKRQILLQTELQQVSDQIEAKFKAMNQMESNDSGFNAIRRAFSETMESMCRDLEILQKERDDLKLKLKNGWKPTKATIEESHKRENVTKKLHALEEKIKDMKKKIEEQNRLLKTQSRNLKGSESLKQDIVELKQAKVRLLKRIKEEANEFRQQKALKNREIQTLQKEKSKQKILYRKLENKMTKQNNVLQRKAEQALAQQKRLKAILEKQKERKQYLNRDNSGNQQQEEEKWKTWLRDQSEFAAETYGLKKTLKEEMSKRNELVHQEDEESVKHRKECTKKIAEIQQFLFESEEESKKNGCHPSKQWSKITSLATGKHLLRIMFKRIVELMHENLESQQEKRYLKDDIADLEELLKDTCHKYELEQAAILQECDEKLLFLMKQNQTAQQRPSTDTIEVTATEFQNNTDFQQQQIESLTQQNSSLIEILESQNNAAIKRKLKEIEKSKSTQREENVSNGAESDEAEWWSNDSESSDGEGNDDSDSDWTDSPKKKQKKRVSDTSLASNKNIVEVKTRESFDNVLSLSFLTRVDHLKVKDLQTALRYLGLPVSGRKQVLQSRLLSHMKEKIGLEEEALQLALTEALGGSTEQPKDEMGSEYLDKSNKKNEIENTNVSLNKVDPIKSEGNSQSNNQRTAKENKRINYNQPDRQQKEINQDTRKKIFQDNRNVNVQKHDSSNKNSNIHPQNENPAQDTRNTNLTKPDRSRTNSNNQPQQKKQLYQHTSRPYARLPLQPLTGNKLERKSMSKETKNKVFNGARKKPENVFKTKPNTQRKPGLGVHDARAKVKPVAVGSNSYQHQEQNSRAQKLARWKLKKEEGKQYRERPIRPSIFSVNK